MTYDLSCKWVMSYSFLRLLTLFLGSGILYNSGCPCDSMSVCHKVRILDLLILRSCISHVILKLYNLLCLVTSMKWKPIHMFMLSCIIQGIIFEILYNLVYLFVTMTVSLAQSQCTFANRFIDFHILDNVTFKLFNL